MLENKLIRKFSTGISALALSVTLGCGSEDDCASMNYSLKGNEGGTYSGSVYSSNNENYDCPPNCSFKGETQDKYCCWCPDE